MATGPPTRGIVSQAVEVYASRIVSALRRPGYSLSEPRLKSRIDNKTNCVATPIIKGPGRSGGRQRTSNILDRAESKRRLRVSRGSLGWFAPRQEKQEEDSLGFSPGTDQIVRGRIGVARSWSARSIKSSESRPAERPDELEIERERGREKKEARERRSSKRGEKERERGCAACSL